MTWPSMKNAMEASYALSRFLVLLISHVHSDLQCNFTAWSTLGNGQNFFAKLLSKLNNLCGIGSGRIFALPLPKEKTRFHRFRFQLPLPHPWFRCLALFIRLRTWNQIETLQVLPWTEIEIKSKKFNGTSARAATSFGLPNIFTAMCVLSTRIVARLTIKVILTRAICLTPVRNPFGSRAMSPALFLFVPTCLTLNNRNVL